MYISYMFRKTLLIVCIFFAQTVYSQESAKYNPSIDVTHYAFHIGLSDANDSILGRAVITVKFTEKVKSVNFDLANINDTGKGMLATSVKLFDKAVSFTHQQNVINITLPRETNIGELAVFEIFYKGVPFDGLIFSKNKFEHRTIFADNWPNRARNWIPCKDHLSDKASVDFIVTAPDHYQVVSNGVKKEETNLPDHLRLTHWKETVPIATKIMVIGVADFAVDYPGEVDGIPVSSWIFPEQRNAGFDDYSEALEILPFYINNIGPYAYKKLANVQSKTIFGGMENAGAIFYSESSVTGKRNIKSLLAHEIAHQWFGDAATESDWPHLWLSEGFATAMTHFYLESKYGHDSIAQQLQGDRAAILAFTKKTNRPVVDSSANRNIMGMLNTNSYQKGGWVLEMLRHQLGDSIFWKSVRKYYATYRDKNASTSDLQKIFEEVSGKGLQTFFTQWLYSPENPTLDISWQYDEKNKKVSINVTQKTKTIFVLPLEIEFKSVIGGNTRQTIHLTQKTTQVSFPADHKPSKIDLDPDCYLLFEGVVKEGQ
jgi:aminopeptidase N